MSAGIYDGHLWTEGKLENTWFNKKIVSNIKSNTELYEKNTNSGMNKILKACHICQN